MTDTTPAALRALADSLEKWGPLVSSGYEVPAAGTAMFRARQALRALAAEKEALVGLEGRIAHRHNTRILELQIAARDARRAALEEAAKVCRTHSWARDISWWVAVTKKEATAEAARECEAAIRALIDREPAPVVADGWQPIETAPKDGTRVLVCGGTLWYSGDWHGHDYPLVEPVIASWDGENWFVGYASEYDNEIFVKPTLWQPLPAPPAPADRGDEG
jgi:hypothetical protein